MTGRLYRLPDGAIPPEELAVLDKRSPVDGEAALAWLNGEGPDPWQSGGSKTGPNSEA